METKNPAVKFDHQCSVPGCYSQTIFAGLCNLHSTRGIDPATEDRRGKNLSGSDIKKLQDQIASGQIKVSAAGSIQSNDIVSVTIGHDRRNTDPKMSFKYPKYYKEIPAGVTELDIYMVCHIFQVQDYSGAIHHAIKKLLLPGVRTGGKSRRDDIKEARDTLTRWLELNQ